MMKRTNFECNSRNSIVFVSSFKTLGPLRKKVLPALASLIQMQYDENDDVERRHERGRRGLVQVAEERRHRVPCWGARSKMRLAEQRDLS